jgi:hypothetical protein
VLAVHRPRKGRLVDARISGNLAQRLARIGNGLKRIRRKPFLSVDMLAMFYLPFASVVNCAIRQRLLEFLDALVGNLGLPQKERLELGQPLEMR